MSPRHNEQMRGLSNLRISLPMLICYVLFVLIGVDVVLENTILREPNHVIGGFGAPFGGFIFFGVVGVFFICGLAGVVAVFFIRRTGWLFAVFGVVAMFTAVSTPYLILKYEPDVDFYPEMPEPSSLVGEWEDKSFWLALHEDGRFELKYKMGRGASGGSLVTGTWEIDRHILRLVDETGKQEVEWEFTKCQGHYFITYSIPENFDAWNGNLGLMRVTHRE